MLFQKEEIDMKNLLKVLLLSIVIISNVACTRRPHHQSGTGRHGHRAPIVTQPNPHNGNNTTPVNPVTPRAVDKAKPNVEQIKRDLVGHSLSEGVKDGYYPSYWRWTISEGEISNFSINQVIIDSSTEYEILSSFRLTSRAGKSFDSKVRICYIFNNSEGWHIQFAQSQGMYIVKTGKYNSCINVDKDSNYYYFINGCDISLEVGGIKYCWVTAGRQEWVKFSEVIAPHEKYTMMYDYRIDYVEIP